MLYSSLVSRPSLLGGQVSSYIVSTLLVEYLAQDGDAIVIHTHTPLKETRIHYITLNSQTITNTPKTKLAATCAPKHIINSQTGSPQYRYSTPYLFFRYKPKKKRGREGTEKETNSISTTSGIQGNALPPIYPFQYYYNTLLVFSLNNSQVQTAN